MPLVAILLGGGAFVAALFATGLIIAYAERNSPPPEDGEP